jgi:hypothetical protein
LVTSGPTGLLAAVAFYLYVIERKELAAERKARIEDAKAYNDLALKLQERALAVADTLRTAIETLRRRDP